MCSVSPLASMSTQARNLPFLVAATILAFGCASTPPSKVVVPIAGVRQADKTNVHISDLRSPQQRQPRVDPEMPEVIYLGDETFEPAPVSMLNLAVSPKLNAAADPFVIELVRLMWQCRIRRFVTSIDLRRHWSWRLALPLAPTWRGI